MDLFKLVNIVDEEFTKHGLWKQRWFFKWDRSLRRFGRCNYTTKTISLSKNLCKLYDEDEVIDTLRHEIAHVLVGTGHGHDEVWRKKAIEIGSSGNRLYKPTISVYKWKAECLCDKPFLRIKRVSGHCTKCKTSLIWKKI